MAMSQEGIALRQESVNGSMDVPTIAGGPLIETTVDDQRFLLNFITGNYLGPDVVSDTPRRAILQRFSEVLLPYGSTDLGSSVLTLQQLECLYGYILKDAHPSVVLKEPSLHQYFNDKLPPPRSGLLEDKRQFQFFFPLEKHLQEKHGRNSKTFNGIVIIDNPDTSHVNPTALERFKLLTHRNEVRINLENFEGHCIAKKEERKEKNMKRRQDSAKHGQGKKKGQPMEPIFVEPLQMKPFDDSRALVIWRKSPAEADNIGGPSTSHYTSTAEVDSQHFSEPSVVYAGTAEGERFGPLDIGISEKCYFCRVSLPGVGKGRLNCKMSCKGEVTIKGLTMTGEDFVCKGSQMFKMMTHHLAPSGEFSISFNLPGPVDSRSYQCSFKDGLFELVANKYTPSQKRKRKC